MGHLALLEGEVEGAGLLGQFGCARFEPLTPILSPSQMGEAEEMAT